LALIFLLTLRNQVSGFFEPSIQSTVDSIRENLTEVPSMNLVRGLRISWTAHPKAPASFAFLVGGFASSPWLSGQLNERLSNLGLKFFKPDTQT